MAVFLITGTSSGFGSQIAKQALQAGHKVIATSRDAGKLSELKDLGAATLSLDINASEADIQNTIKEAAAIYGTIDILVNNAGYIWEGAVEEASAAEIQATFHTNVFAHVAVTQAVLPYLRAQKSGTIAFMGSIAGWEGGVACGLYCGVKFAVAGIAESLREEVASFGIKVTVVEPGYFRTNFLASGSKFLAKNPIADYEPVLAPIKGAFQAFNGNQPGDPVKGAQLIVEALTGTGRAEGRELPRRLLIGPDAVGFVTGVIEKETKSVEAWKDLSVTTNLDQSA
ncbi:hypothetical protein DPSP01_011411 [Paraphaeosphaeria sporulosa]|uniref:NAD(P)-binding protein n=1 Tax=Paraphaeosphaeria sporulosa TaxID=1460663 RepID=A0A177BWN3_9PLEO|nr:NAD(P)-binding protein [Paraphaeosphaeria sporulosa]OAF99161.1 NAD(P)-binding protein [Paraphaeosphaeria sporulosa]